MELEDSAIKEYKVNLKSGFTVAELLISMLICTILATALVPIIGMKKVKDPIMSSRHGIYECYWSDDGSTLMEYYADNGDRKGAVAESVSGNYCKFMPPTADGFQMFAIGVGGEGYGDNLYSSINLPTINSSSTIASGTITMDGDNGFQSSIEASEYAEKIKEVFTAWANGDSSAQWNGRQLSRSNRPYAVFSKIKGPLGATGRGLAYKAMAEGLEVYVNNVPQNCNNLCYGISSNCPEPYRPKDGSYITEQYEPKDAASMLKPSNQCVYYFHGAGGDSGKGWQLKSEGSYLRFPISGDSSVNVSNTQQALTISTNGSVGDYQLLLGASGDGEDPVYATQAALGYWIPGDEGRAASSIYITNGIKDDLGGNATASLFTNDKEYQTKGPTHGSECDSMAGTGNPCAYGPWDAQFGSYQTTSDAFSWKYTGSKATLRYAQAGVTGTEMVYNYPKLKGPLYIFPGKANVRNTVVTLSPNMNESRIVEPIQTPSASKSSLITLANYAITDETVPYDPNGEILNGKVENGTYTVGAVAQNDSLTYVNQIQTTGFKGGLYSCYQNGNCPGFAKHGYYPFIGSITYSTKLQITNKQPDNGASPGAEKTWTHNVSTGDNTCHDGSAPINNTVCKGGNAKRGNGAVIIIW